MKVIKEKLKENEFIMDIYNKVSQNYYKYLFTDEQLIQKKYMKEMGRKANLENPNTFNEKIQWLKLNWYDPLAIKCADKFEVREYVKKTIGSEYLIELLGVYETVDEINLNDLPNSFVFKATHGSGFNIICKDKNNMNWKKEFRKMRRWLKTNYYWANREWVYKDIKPRIICEKFLSGDKGQIPEDYKFFCFDGEPKFLYIASDRGIDTKFDFYDLNWNKIPVSQCYPNSDYIYPKPDNLDLIIELARKLSKGFPHVRVDFYILKDRIIFGELTFFHFSGTKKFIPEKYDKVFGDYIDLSKIKNKKYLG